ncbi:ATP-binding protein [Sneathia sanguinegens]|jgi:hypothetical protein|nr:ATP-binding protein [Sneathia sanguinegens]MDU4652574.1 ATP-binding protein [Sneathia sanguinegens]
MVKLSISVDVKGNIKSSDEIEESIRTKFRKVIWSKFLKGISEFNLVEDGDKIALAISGGKDSLLMAKLFQELKKDRTRNFEFKAISLNPGFEKEDLEQFKKNLANMKIDCEIIDTNIWQVSNKMSPDSPCFLCAKMRRGILYKELERLGFNKIALGHHFDDVIETTLINIFYGGTVKTMLPMINSESGNLKLIRPMVYVHEADIIEFTKTNNIRAMSCGCAVEQDRVNSKRKEIKRLLKDLEEKNPGIKRRIFSSMKNVNLDYVYGYTKKKGNI